jgi:RimJ/RimL family protein N-acetyltransferase
VDDVRDLASALEDVDVAVSAAGSTTWELAALGVPTVLVPVAPNQHAVAVAAARHGTACASFPPAGAPFPDVQGVADLVGGLLADPAARVAQAGAGPRLIDGRGAARVVSRMRAAAITLRRAVMDDARLLWEWANDPVVRAAGAHPEPISWDEHVTWLTARLEAPREALFVASDDDGVVGQVRFAPVPSTDVSEIGVLVASSRRGERLAAPLIDAGVRRAFDELAPDVVVARVRVTNEASRQAFLAADFDLDDGLARWDAHDPVEWLRYTRPRHGHDR